MCGRRTAAQCCRSCLAVDITRLKRQILLLPSAKLQLHTTPRNNVSARYVLSTSFIVNNSSNTNVFEEPWGGGGGGKNLQIKMCSNENEKLEQKLSCHQKYRAWPWIGLHTERREHMRGEGESKMRNLFHDILNLVYARKLDDRDFLFRVQKLRTEKCTKTKQGSREKKKFRRVK